MEYQIGTKCVSKLQQISSTAMGSTARTNNLPALPRRTNSVGCPPLHLQENNSWARPLVNNSRSHLSIPRRPISYGYSHQSSLWLQRPGVQRSASANDWPIKSASTDEPEKKNNMTPHTTSSIAQPQLQQQQMIREPVPSATVEMKQAKLEKRAATLATQLRRLQYCQSRAHIETEINSTSNSLRRALDNATLVREAETLNDIRSLLNDPALEQKLDSLIKNGELRPDFLNSGELRYASPAAMVQVLRKYDPFLKKIVSFSSSTAGQTTASSTSVPISNHSVPSNVALDLEDRQYLGRVTQSLQSHLTVLRRDYDSDATESSSGGESCDEDEKETERSDTRPSGKFRHTALEHRASWQWWTERGWIGSRWAWIQFQLADLEYKIRQHADMHKQLRYRKNRQTFSATPALKKNSADASNPNIRPPENCDGNSSDTEDLSSALDGCARTRPVDLPPIRRRIIRTAGMFRWNRKTLVRSTIHCGCFPPISPCITCSGRRDNKEKVNTHQPMNLRNAILEPYHHPVLAPQRSRGFGLERKLQAFWNAPKAPFRNAPWFPPQKTIVTLLPHSRDNQGNYIKGTTTSDGNLEKRRRGRKPGSTLAKRHLALSNKQKISTLKRAKKYKRDYSRCDSYTAGGSALTSSMQEDNGTAGKLGSRRATERHSTTFDIDNIFVDPRVAAVTRVEKIQYKEIQTPEWRIRELKELSLANLAQNAEMEDISDEAFGVRHNVKETAEKKRFQPILFRDFHSARRAQLLSQSSSIDSNGSGGGATPVVGSQILPAAPSFINSINNDKLSDGATPAERTYEPFTPRQFPMNGDEMAEDACNLSNGYVNEKFGGDDDERPPSV